MLNSLAYYFCPRYLCAVNRGKQRKSLQRIFSGIEVAGKRIQKIWKIHSDDDEKSNEDEDGVDDEQEEEGREVTDTGKGDMQA